MAVDLTSGPEVGLLNLHFFNICRHHPTLKFKPHATDDEGYVWGIDGVPLNLFELVKSFGEEIAKRLSGKVLVKKTMGNDKLLLIC